jgi:disulfide bond formation protein DsbB
VNRRQLPAPTPFLLLALLAVPFVFAAACGGGGGGGGGTATANPEQVAAGQKVFLGTCATCHGKDAHGLPRQGKDLHASQFVAEKNDEEMVAFIKTGRRAGDPLNTTGVDMPPKGGNPALSEADIANVIAYVRTLD